MVQIVSWECCSFSECDTCLQGQLLHHDLALNAGSVYDITSYLPCTAFYLIHLTFKQKVVAPR